MSISSLYSVLSQRKNGGGGGADGGAAEGGDGRHGHGEETATLARNHAILCCVGFLILLPLGVLLARYARTFTHRWFWGHTIIQLVISGPVIFAGWALGHNLADELHMEVVSDPHQKIGVALLAMYVTQLLLGGFIHFVKLPIRGHRPPQNYLHAVLGLAIIGLAGYQIHYGMTIEWLFTEQSPVPDSALHTWLALIIVFWALYLLGMALVPRQFLREKAGREAMRKAAKEGQVQV